MLNLAQAKSGHGYTVKNLDGDTRFISRITSVGLTTGGKLTVIRNTKRMPLLVYSRDTVLAINRMEAENIYLEVNEK